VRDQIAFTVPGTAARRPDFTILLPIIRPPVTLGYALGSVLAQTVDNIEVVILCDGAPPETVSEAERLARTDRRVRVAAFPKGARHGEAHRAKIVGETTGRNLAQIADDDLWFPDHLAILRDALERVDFANTSLTLVLPEGRMRAAHWGHLRDPATRTRMLGEKFSFFGPTECAYRRSAYDALPDGWTPAPPDIYSDLHMWRKFVSRNDLRFDSIFRPTSFKFPAWRWCDEPPEAVNAALRSFADRLRTTWGAAILRRQAHARIALDRSWQEQLQILRLDPWAFAGLAPIKMVLTPIKMARAVRRQLGAAATRH
jgi:glycosyltransferase involved in cell wall biosynthesis